MQAGRRINYNDIIIFTGHTGVWIMLESWKQQQFSSFLGTIADDPLITRSLVSANFR